MEKFAKGVNGINVALAIGEAIDFIVATKIVGIIF